MEKSSGKTNNLGPYLFSGCRENSYCHCFKLLQIQFVPHLSCAMMQQQLW